MRPGQTAPECMMKDKGQFFAHPSFNEAGADCPGMHLTLDDDFPLT